MSVWDWYYSYQEQVFESPNLSATQAEMFDVFYLGAVAEDLSVTRKCYEQARELAESVGDEAFTLWCDAWLGITIGYQCEYEESLKILSQAAVKARDRRFNGLPQQIMVNALVLDRMADIDPLGYLPEISKGIAYLEETCGHEPEHACVFLQSMTLAQLRIGDLEEAKQYVERLGDAVNQVPNYKDRFYLFTSTIHAFENEWDESLTFADLGLQEEDITPQRECKLLLARATALVKLGDLDGGRTAFRRAQRALQEVSCDEDHFDWLTMYYQACGDEKSMIEVRLRQQDESMGKARYWERAKGAKHLWELYRKCGDQQQTEYWRQQAIERCGSIRNPKPILDALEAEPAA